MKPNKTGGGGAPSFESEVISLLEKILEILNNPNGAKLELPKGLYVQCNNCGADMSESIQILVDYQDKEIEKQFLALSPAILPPKIKKGYLFALRILKEVLNTRRNRDK